MKPLSKHNTRIHQHAVIAALSSLAGKRYAAEAVKESLLIADLLVGEYDKRDREAEEKPTESSGPEIGNYEGPLARPCAPEAAEKFPFIDKLLRDTFEKELPFFYAWLTDFYAAPKA